MSDTLIDRRKAATRRDIARSAAALFADRGPAAVTVDEISANAGVSLRTFYRYFRVKEDAVEPIMADGAERWLNIFADIEASDVPLADALLSAARGALDPADAQYVDDLRLTRQLLAARRTDPDLAATWHRIALRYEDRLRELLAHRRPEMGELDVRAWAAAAGAANRIAVEAWADAAPDVSRECSPADIVAELLPRMTCGLNG